MLEQWPGGRSNVNAAAASPLSHPSARAYSCSSVHRKLVNGGRKLAWLFLQKGFIYNSQVDLSGGVEWGVQEACIWGTRPPLQMRGPEPGTRDQVAAARCDVPAAPWRHGPPPAAPVPCKARVKATALAVRYAPRIINTGRNETREWDLYQPDSGTLLIKAHRKKVKVNHIRTASYLYIHISHNKKLIL